MSKTIMFVENMSLPETFDRWSHQGYTQGNFPDRNQTRASMMMDNYEMEFSK
jgi:hypothetical protein